MTITFTIPGEPIPQPRQRHRVVQPKGKQPFVQNYTPKDDPVNDYKDAARKAASKVFAGPPLEGPLALYLTFLFPRPGRLIWKTRPMPRRWHTSRPDNDNLQKACKDSLTGIIWHDDAQVSFVVAEKKYAAGDEAPQTIVQVVSLLSV